LENLLKTMHKGTRHVGKAPHGLRQSRDLADRLKQLQRKLDRAVADEDFEQAASLRDEIRGTRDQMEHLAPGVKS
jgi:protein arginine kinase activator